MTKTRFFFTAVSCLLFATGVFSQQAIKYSHPAVDDEFVGPFPSWINVKAQFGAVGDGKHDDTQALQAAFDTVGRKNKGNLGSVVYLPAGTYLISATLVLKSRIAISIIGEDPATTKIIWGGPQDGTMLYINGVAYSRFNRICWDGKKTAKYAINSSWDGKQNYFDTANEFADDEFTDVGFGLHGGFAHSVSFAETAIMRCKFIRNTVAGLSLGNYNALDIWVWNSLFEDCGIAATNDVEKGSGNFKIYNSIFRRSLVADIKIGNTGEFSFRDNTSSNSKVFLTAAYSGNPCSIDLQGNTIIDPIDNIPINVKNQGQLTMLDNIIRSPANATAPVVAVTGKPNPDCFAIGNTFTVANPIQSDRNIVYNNTIVSRNDIASLKEQVLPGTQPFLNRTVFEVPAGANRLAIQNIIDKANTLVGKRPVIHFPPGTYKMDTTLIIPASSDIQLVGDGNTSIISYNTKNDGTILKIMGPTKVTLRDLQIVGNKKADGLLVTNADQPASRIFAHEAQSNSSRINYSIEGLDHTLVLLTNSNFAHATEKALNVVGGPLALAGNPAKGRTIIYACSSSNNFLNIELSHNANLLVRDTWYESTVVNQFLKLDDAGIFSLDGSHIANNTDNVTPQMKLSNFKGKVTFLGSNVNDRIEITGDGTSTRFLGLGVNSALDDNLKDSTTIKGDVRNLNVRSSQFKTGMGSYAVNNTGVAEESHITSMLESIRNVHALVLHPLPAGVTDLRLYRAYTDQCSKGMVFTN